MSVIRKRKKSLLKAGALGGILVFLPLMLVILYLSVVIYENKLILIKQNKSNKENITAYRLINDKEMNEIIAREDLLEVTLEVEKGTYSTVKEQDIVGKRAKIDLGIHTIINEDLIYEGNVLGDDIRLYQYNCIKFSEEIKKGDFVDIRISFPNGADFILLSKKKVIDYTSLSIENNTENSMWLEVSEEEILRFSSAVVDAYEIQNCSIYAISYIEETQKEAVVTYPVNKVVEVLIEKDPNIVNKAFNVLESDLRKQLELESYYGDSSQNYYNKNVNEQNSELVYPIATTDDEESEQKAKEEIEYVD